MVSQTMTTPHWKTLYLPPDQTQWQGRHDIPPRSCFFHLMNMMNLLSDPVTPTDMPTFALLGFRCDEGVRRNLGRVGAAEGPAAIRQALAKFPVQKQSFVCYDVGNIICLDGDLEASQQALGEVVALLLNANINPIIMGGGHEVAWGHYQGIAKIRHNRTLGIINFDAHFDMRPLLQHDKGTSGTAFLQIAKHHTETNTRFDYNCVGIQHTGNIHPLFETAKAYNTKIVLADELHQGQLQTGVDFIDRIIDANDFIYLSLCLDVFAVSFAPGVSAIQPLGLCPWNIIPLLRQLAASGKVISYDIAELCPRYDIDHRTAKLAAHLIYEIIHHHNTHPRPW